MIPGAANNSFLVLVVLVFVAVMLLLEAVYLLWRAYHGPEARKVKHRLQVLSGARERNVQTRLLRDRMLSELPAVQRVLARMSVMHTLDRFILQSGLDWTVSRLLTSCALLFVFVWFAIRMEWPAAPLVAPVTALLAGGLPLVFVAWKRHDRLRTIERQLPDSLDVRYFVVAVLVQRESGGNLTEILGNLSRLVRERLKLLARVKVLSSEGRLSAWILGLMPFALGALMNIFNPEFMSVMWRDPIGIAITQYLLLMMAVGVLVLVKVVKIHV
jgi:tight adherence protein B